MPCAQRSLHEIIGTSVKISLDFKTLFKFETFTSAVNAHEFSHHTWQFFRNKTRRRLQVCAYIHVLSHLEVQLLPPLS